MSINIFALIALVAILMALVVMVAMRWPSAKVMPVVWLVLALFTIALWLLPVAYVTALSIQGVITAAGILITESVFKKALYSEINRSLSNESFAKY